MKPSFLLCALLLARVGLAQPTLFTNSESISITNATVSSAAEPYPSVIAVAGLDLRTLTRVTVTLHGLSHTYPDDLDILLVGPHGQHVMLISDAGGDNSVTGLTLTFDDGSASILPDSGTLNSGSFRPQNFSSLPDSLPAPAPAAPHAASLSAFNGTNPNGNWYLYVMDDTPEDTGTVAAGWTLSRETELQQAAVLASGVYQTVAGAMVEEIGDRVPNHRRVVPITATFTFDLQATPPSMTAVIPNAVLEGDDPFALTVRSSFGARLTDGTWYFRGDYLEDIYPSGTQYLFDWRFSTQSNGGIVWNGGTGWAGGHIWHVAISNIAIVARAPLVISRAGNGSVQITWPSDFADHVLENASSVTSTSWSTVTNTVTIANDRLVVTVTPNAATQFYRLRKP